MDDNQHLFHFCTSLFFAGQCSPFLSSSSSITCTVYASSPSLPSCLQIFLNFFGAVILDNLEYDDEVKQQKLEVSSLLLLLLLLLLLSPPPPPPPLSLGLFLPPFTGAGET